MLEKLRKSKLLFWSVEFLIVALFILVCTQIQFVFKPIGAFFSTLFAPILVAGFLYYMLNPIINQLEKWRIKRIWGILIVFLLLIGALIFFVAQVLPQLVNQIAQIAASIPDFVKAVEKQISQLLHDPMIRNIDVQKYMKGLDLSFGKIAETVFSGVTSSLGSIIAKITNVTIVIFTVPMLLFYMFKDGDKLLPAVTRFVPEKHRHEAAELLVKMNRTISAYISGQALVCLFVGSFTCIGYFLIGMKYAVLLGFIAGITNIIPYVGPYIGLAPALIIGFMDSPLKAVLVCVVVLTVQQIDGNFISPNVIGKSLSIHPLTIIIILLVAGNIAGVIGMVLGVPFYAVMKTVVSYIYDILQLENNKEPDKEVPETNNKES